MRNAKVLRPMESFVGGMFEIQNDGDRVAVHFAVFAALSPLKLVKQEH
jgi:hypothetical protein